MSRQEREQFSKRQRQVLDALVLHGSNKSIAKAIGVSAKSVEYHIGRAMIAASVTDRVQLAVWWDRQWRAPA